MSAKTNGRIKRAYLSDDTAEPIETPKIEYATFETLCKQGKIQPGMRVKFNYGEIPEIPLERVQTGRDQICRPHLDDGVVILEDDGTLSIFTIIRHSDRMFELLVLKDRYGRGFYNETLQKIVSSVGEYLHESNIKIPNDICYYLNNSNLFSNYILCSSFKRIFLSTSLLKTYSIFFHPLNDEGCGMFYGATGDIAITISPETEKCRLRDCKKITTHEPISFAYNPYPQYLEVSFGEVNI